MDKTEGDIAEAARLTARLATARLLVVDDEPGMRNFLVKTLAPHCREVVEADSAEAADALTARQLFDVVILDNRMPGRSGLEWLAEQRRRGSLSDTIIMTAFADLDTAIEAMRAGAVDFVLKPFRSNQLLNAVRRCVELAAMRRENALLRHELATGDPGRSRRARLIGASPQIEEVRQMLERVARVPSPVLLTGESGTGKEVAARHLHGLSERAAGPFVPVNCAAIPADMLEIELFGHTRGAFPGADAPREGLLVSAQGGTVFLDEIGELSASAQTALRRVIEDRAVRPVGSERERPLDIRLVFATSKNLPEEVAAGRFREDLWFRVNVLEINMPPLRRRGADTVDLARLFVTELSSQLGLPGIDIDAAARAAILRHDWPGNIRELRNFVERALIFGRFPVEQLNPPPSGPIEPLDDVERREILSALEATGGNRAEAARRLGVSRKTIDRKCAAWGL
ncbi:sigma-54 dependent transcriptional regulator [Limimaricola variabilis]|uniref:sigma-54-dependent transcriptional regulator n=1 Tax=Limimaricola variabilis TaxID=1492771 RepID=UPI002AC96430|nr:sigma-54 dependent transcriptional regulator [Limimaricola variabilis]WPY94367.1 sigma-54 dependent transcriptional regulator [Limimaricola variabilis]